MAKKPLGQMLVEQGAVSEDDIRRALNFQKTKKVRLGEALVSLGCLEEDQVARLLAKQAGLPFVDLSKGRIAQDVIELVAKSVVEDNRILPVMLKGDSLIVAVDDPDNVFALDTLRFVLDWELKPALAAPKAFRRALRTYYGVGAEEEQEKTSAELDADADDAPIICMVQKMVDDALDQRASDIHVEPFPDRVRVRFRIDGVLREVATHPKHLQGPLSSRLKIMAGMDIAERRKPQDGRINILSKGRDIDIRASVLPANHGETVVMRLLDRERGLVSLGDLGLDQEDQQTFESIIKRPNGIFLVTGPTGSGKTTTLYAALKALNRPDVKIITAEDPVEYHLVGINQVQVRADIGLSFARILRAMLRQAPNIILVGEIRDAETAEIAIQAALTGHLVFSTLHTNDAPSALTRLIDMGVKPFLVSASVTAVLAQRLVRRLCPSCRIAYAPEKTELASLDLKPESIGDSQFYRPEGCAECEFTGFRGRLGIFELLVMDPVLRDLTYKCNSAATIRDQGRASGHLTRLVDDGVRKVLSGLTTPSEVLRIVHV